MDADGRTATCALCGPIGIARKGVVNGRQRWSCETVRNKYVYGTGHGLTRAKMLELKKGAICAICGGTYNLAIDHNHQTGALRGILCGTCNPALGAFKDSIELLEEAIKYLKNPPGVE